MRIRLKDRKFYVNEGELDTESVATLESYSSEEENAHAFPLF